MQRPTATRRGKSLLPCDDDDDRDDRDAKSRATRARKQDDNLRKANVAALILGFTYFLYYLNSSAFAPEVVLTTGPNYSEVLHSPTPEEIHEHTGVAPALPGTEPLKCHEFVHQVQLGTYRVHVEDPNKKTGIFSRKTTTGHPFRVSLHHEKLDKRKWVIMTKGRYSEHHLENIWADILRGSKPGARVLDVGYVLSCSGILYSTVFLTSPILTVACFLIPCRRVTQWQHRLLLVNVSVHGSIPR
jgi:hypothetical protein